MNSYSCPELGPVSVLRLVNVFVTFMLMFAVWGMIVMLVSFMSE